MSAQRTQAQELLAKFLARKRREAAQASVRASAPSQAAWKQMAASSNSAGLWGGEPDGSES